MARLLTAATLALCLSLSAETGLLGQGPGEARAGAGPAASQADPPWPAASVLAERQRDAEARPLFQTAEPLTFTLTTDFKAIDRDRDPSSTKTYAATIAFAGPDGTTITRALKVRGRGHTRRGLQTCDFSPLRLEFTKDEMAGTVFAGQGNLKLGTHCRSSAVFEQFVLREYTAYRILNLLTPQSFRARLAKATYVDGPTKKPIGERYAMFLEDDDELARRMGGRINGRRVYGFSRVDPDHLTLVALFEYMIGNTDVAFKAQHNVQVVETPAGARYAVPYDFDYSGLVNAPYAVVDTQRIRGITTVRERLYLGPCRTAEDIEPVLARMRAVKDRVYALYDDLSAFTDASRRDARNYLDGFYRTIDRPADVKRRILSTCKADG